MFLLITFLVFSSCLSDQARASPLTMSSGLYSEKDCYQLQSGNVVGGQEDVPLYVCRPQVSKRNNSPSRAKRNVCNSVNWIARHGSALIDHLDSNYWQRETGLIANADGQGKIRLLHLPPHPGLFAHVRVYACIELWGVLATGTERVLQSIGIRSKDSELGHE
jgi:hypothetical protein